jgi:hypothetical protein
MMYQKGDAAMSNSSARADYLARTSGEIADALRINLPCDLFDLDQLFRTDKPAAYAQLASYTDAQRVALATAFAALYTARYALAGDDALTADFILCLWRPHLEPSAPATAAAEHSLPSISSEPSEDTMINVTFDSEVTPAPAPIAQIRMLHQYSAPVVAALRLALVLHHDAPAFTRALDKFIGVAGSTPFLFDGRTLAIASQSESGTTILTDGAACTCRGASHAFCYHRAGWALLRALDAVCDPFAPFAPAEPVPFDPAA